MTEPMLSEEVVADLDELCAAFHHAVTRLGISTASLRLAAAGECRLSTAIDPYDSAEQLLGEWIDDDGCRYAHFVRYGDGNMFAEHDVLQPHPGNAGLFVEAIEVWGHAGALKNEARLLPAL